MERKNKRRGKGGIFLPFLRKIPPKRVMGLAGLLCPSFLFLAHRSSGSVPVQRERAKKKRKEEKRKERTRREGRSKTEARDPAIYLFREALSSFSRDFGQPLRTRLNKFRRSLHLTDVQIARKQN
jgi:hypothetical protein